MTTTLKVNEGGACGQCPLVWSDGDNLFCAAAENRPTLEPKLTYSNPPTWCPLKSGDVLVRLVRKGGS